MATDSFNQDFCSYLEYHISKTFKNSNEKSIQRLWCDGISHEPLAKSIKDMHNTRKLITTAWIGYDGQSEYRMTLKFGDNALKKYAKGLDLRACVPSENSMDWIKIDTKKKTIELELK